MYIYYMCTPCVLSLVPTILFQQLIIFHKKHWKKKKKKNTREAMHGYKATCVQGSHYQCNLTPIKRSSLHMHMYTLARHTSFSHMQECIQFSCYQHRYTNGEKDLWCALVQFGCYQHTCTCEWKGLWCS